MSTISRKEDPVRKLKATAQNFADQQTWGGLVLIICTVIAIIASNSPIADAYHHFWERPIIIASEELRLNKSLHHWINDGLMVIFFFVIGLELKREIFNGELSEWKKASMPVYAAVGGMVIPALIFLVFNLSEPTQKGWGIPMATDIAYSLGILALLGNRIPLALKVFLTALAIVDDLGAIIVITLFYSEDINWYFLMGVLAVEGVLFLFNYFGIRTIWLYVLGAIALWFLMLYSGIHTTMAGVLAAITIPIKVKMKGKEFLKKTNNKLDELKDTDLHEGDALREEEQHEVIQDIRKYTIKSRSPLMRLENGLSPVSSFVIIPLFALANAGVEFSTGWTSIFSNNLGLGILTGLLLGKLIGVVLFSFLSQKLGLSTLSEQLRWIDIVGLGLLTGIGFTMSLFIANLAFEPGGRLDEAKMAILIASFTASIIGFALFYFAGKKKS